MTLRTRTQLRVGGHEHVDTPAQGFAIGIRACATSDIVTMLIVTDCLQSVRDQIYAKSICLNATHYVFRIHGRCEESEAVQAPD
jgi:hypothetical protein